MPEEFRVGQKVRVKLESEGTNRRVPEYARGGTGTIVRVYGAITGFQHDHAEDWGSLYSVLLDASSPLERVYLDIHGPWLENVDKILSRDDAVPKGK